VGHPDRSRRAVTTDGGHRIVEGGIGDDGLPNPGASIVARVPAKATHQRGDRPLPTRHGPHAAPVGAGAGHSADRKDGLPERAWDPAAVLVSLLGSANLSSRNWVYQQYDSSVQRTPSSGPGHGAAVLRVKGTTKALVQRTDGNQTVSAIDPHLGAQLSVAEAHAQTSASPALGRSASQLPQLRKSGAPRSVLAGCRKAVRGMAEACLALSVPVTGGNVSLYNEYPGGAIAPTPEIGVVGLLEDISLLVRPPFTTEGDAVILVGASTPAWPVSAYAALAGISSEDSPPGIDLDREAALQFVRREAIGRGLVASAQDVSGGGLAVAVAECAMWSGLGAKLRLGVSVRLPSSCWGEPVAARAVVPPAPRPGDRVARKAVHTGSPHARDRRRGSAAASS